MIYTKVTMLSRTPTPEPTTLFVDKLTRNVNKDHLLEIFGKYGKLKNVELQWDRRANLPKGSAYVEYSLRSDAEKAQIFMDGVSISLLSMSPFAHDEITSKVSSA